MKWASVLAILIISGCASRPETISVQNTNSDTPASLQQSVRTNSMTATMQIDSCQWMDLSKKITPSGNYLAYERFDNVKYRVVWGNENLKRILPDTFYCDAPLMTQPVFKKENKNYLEVRFGCGTSCWESIYLPLDKQQTPVRIAYPYAADLDHHLVAALDQDETKIFIAVHNLKTGKIQEIKLGSCDSAIPTYCLDSLSITGKDLYVRWNADALNKSTKEYRVKIP